MTKLNTRKSSLFISAVIFSSILSTMSHASGSFGPSSGGGLQNPYNMGKFVYHRKIACDTCLIPTKNLDKDSAMKLIEMINKREDIAQKLKLEERKAAIYYLKKRHKIS